MIGSDWVAVALAFLLGSLPFSWILVWLLRGVDLRTVGSGNPGATNAFRVVGKGWGTLALLLDIGKGLAAVLAPHWLSPETGWLPAACGLAAILGNVFCPFLKFKGGKAVATASGVFLGLVPLSFLITAIVFGLVFWWTRQVSLGSLAGAVALPLILTGFYITRGTYAPHATVVALVWFAAILVIFRHRANIHRILKGEEFSFRSPVKSDPPGA
ncbi:MAG: glycerol-3-phosphate 1-O-acyltransferase PlsY [Candidatus Omnitrophica bacterium]|nr:glycerol-3-phosphate 1-O-acyltransferase PlsY [Candidatus Omnitrophota bacterium]